MPSLSRLLLAAVLAAPCAPALAADLDAPVYADEAPEYVPVEVGAAWYLRGDLGYQFDGAYDRDRDLNGAYRAAETGIGSSDDYVTGSAGIGYHFTDFLRADANIGYIPGNVVDVRYDDGDNGARAELSNDGWYGMANVYLDLGTVAGFTPYVGAGAGVLANKWERKAKYDLAGEDPRSISDEDRRYAFAYSLDAGLAYRFARNLSLDLGYQFIASPDARYVDVTDPEDLPVREGLQFHQIRLGLRYDLW